MSRNLKNYSRGLMSGAKIYPEDLAGMIGLPHVGKVLYVDANSGSDNNNGRRQSQAFDTVAAAYDVMTSGNHDVVIIAPSGGTGRTAETTAITWGKRFA